MGSRYPHPALRPKKLFVHLAKVESSYVNERKWEASNILITGAIRMGKIPNVRNVGSCDINGRPQGKIGIIDFPWPID
jgi:hypothetical protein